MSDTPRTSVIEKSAKEVYVGYAYTSALELARDLERELASEKSKVARLRGLLLLTSRNCVDLHHAKKDRHDFCEPCPVEARINSELKEGA